ncbi:MAG: Unknown protein [uncultured Thiotrichaceae bacterium]|uniref:Ancillary SecYEG translocon subunit/Cell division coordinator CpoB TPR domain-containing protein n=1 Tax=uncultured Thiotrichaceae bacterium TaxID=298394 RepID=A0A6S6U2V2_9GAMM|nr:MAG: Unknown protein [uncultured Thiotrichaceae bacterium]
MTDLKTDAEKAEEIKAWWKENGKSVLTGVAVAIVGIFGWQQWQSHTKTQAETASALYSTTQTTYSAESLESLKADHSSSPYASIAALSAAKHFAESGKEAEAITELQWAADNAKEDTIQHIAKIRLTRLLIATAQLDKAATLLSDEFPATYNPLVEELKGDLALAKEDKSSAAEAYRRAIFQSGNMAPRYLQMKLDSLGNGV